AVGDGFGEIFGGERVPGEFGGHGNAHRESDVQRAIEQLGAGGGWNAAGAKPWVHGGAAGRIADARCVDGRSEKDAGHGSGVATSANRGGRISGAGIVCGGCGERHSGVVDRAKCAGAKTSTGKNEPDYGSVCDELQVAGAAEFSVGGGRSDDEGFQGKEFGGQLRGGQRGREGASGQYD